MVTAPSGRMPAEMLGMPADGRSAPGRVALPACPEVPHYIKSSRRFGFPSEPSDLSSRPAPHFEQNRIGTNQFESLRVAPLLSQNLMRCLAPHPRSTNYC